jgi:anaerobic carbon-monoxide dehydrogenase iron sulfur subunit
MSTSRRDFIKNLAMGTGGILFAGTFGVAFRLSGQEETIVKGIVVDFTRCTGCRTCETVCSAFNNPVNADGKVLNGLGNPWLSNIKVHGFNPDADVPMVCSLCEDAPCIAACPVPPDLHTGHRALFKNRETLAVYNDNDRCIGCGQCAKACRNMRTGVMSRNDSGKPFGMCSLCQGDPRCIAYCPYDALQYVELNDANAPFRKMSPQAIASRLVKEFYDMDVQF